MLSLAGLASLGWPSSLPQKAPLLTLNFLVRKSMSESSKVGKMNYILANGTKTVGREKGGLTGLSRALSRCPVDVDMWRIRQY